MSFNIDEIFARATQAHAAGRLTEADRLCDVVAAGKPKDPKVLLLQGIVASKLRQFRKAAMALQSALN
ncbi:MAG TPA: hypothetical protein VG944_10195, partial [Fimbriimonas sp.]|nr:hypothetical protein [Fimbriimonas sp.]